MDRFRRERIMRTGERVEVRVKFTDTWAPGFEIAEVVDGRYRLRRTSDGAVLPEPTGPSDLRPVASYGT
jgi:hypothetical protein